MRPSTTLACIYAGFIALAIGLVSLHSLKPDTQARSVLSQPDVIIDVLDPSLQQYANGWQTEIGRRFHNAVGVFCHGGDVLANQWLVVDHPGSAYAVSSVYLLIREEQSRYPGRTLVLLSCNPKHNTIHDFPNVYYSPSSVWCVPDRDYVPDPFDFRMSYKIGWPQLKTPPPTLAPFTPAVNRSVADPDSVGNIFEFNEAR